MDAAATEAFNPGGSSAAIVRRILARSRWECQEIRVRAGHTGPGGRYAASARWPRRCLSSGHLPKAENERTDRGTPRGLRSRRERAGGIFAYLKWGMTAGSGFPMLAMRWAPQTPHAILPHIAPRCLSGANAARCIFRSRSVDAVRPATTRQTPPMPPCEGTSQSSRELRSRRWRL